MKCVMVALSYHRQIKLFSKYRYFNQYFILYPERTQNKFSKKVSALDSAFNCASNNQKKFQVIKTGLRVIEWENDT